MFELKRLADYSDESLIIEIRRVAELIHQPTMSKTEFTKHSRVHSSTIEKRFGCWEKALNAAGLIDRFDVTNKAVSKETVLAELQRVSRLHDNQILDRKKFNANADFTDHVVRRVFGSWHKAMQAAGLAANKMGRRYTDDECFENLLQVWTHYGRPPQHREMTLAPSIVGPKAYVLRWGTWNKALHAFVDRINEDMKQDDGIKTEIETVKETPKNKLDERDRRDIKLGLRYTVLSRDRFKCLICGESPATSIDCRLHVDHIYPFSKGGKTEISNLRTLCEKCNLGKSAKIEEIT